MKHYMIVYIIRTVIYTELYLTYDMVYTYGIIKTIWWRRLDHIQNRLSFNCKLLNYSELWYEKIRCGKSIEYH